ncbi:MAG: GNAT family N-acetyltransferase [Rhizobiaceae bacterium]|nr:GNAT family N-acetyltransferase [Rhizobiaceae bacterium]
MVNIRPADSKDIEWLIRHDDHVDEGWIRRCIQSSEYLLAEQNATLIGFLRFSQFWGKIPYMEMIRVLPDYRRCGVGTALYRTWEAAMAAEEFGLLMTSSERGETEPQDWHRRNGFREAGEIHFVTLQTSEVFFIKEISLG